MTIARSRAVFIVLGTLALAACGPDADQASEPSPGPAATAEPEPRIPPPPVSVNETMVALVDHAGHVLWDAEQEGGNPETDADWLAVEEHAIQLAAAGRLLLLGGQGTNDLVWMRDPEWRRWAGAMSDAGLGALRAARAKDLDALVEANGQLVDSCEGCHQEFKPELPSEGIVHAHMH